VFFFCFFVVVCLALFSLFFFSRALAWRTWYLFHW